MNDPAQWLLTRDSWKRPPDGRPFGLESNLGKRAKNDEPVWDEGCKVEYLNGGADMVPAILDDFKTLIDYTKTTEGSAKPFGERGHVYIAGWRLDPERRMYPYSSENADVTIWCKIRELMEAGIKVRIMVWNPTFLFRPHRCAHWYLALLMYKLNKKLRDQYPINQDIGVVLLDSRGRTTCGSNHQKFMIIRSEALNVAYCGGIDFAYTRFDLPEFDGDRQSGNNMPSIGSIIGDSNPEVKIPCSSSEIPSDLNDHTIYSNTYQKWFDQHLRLEGSIVATLEHIFLQRWSDDTNQVNIIPEISIPDVSFLLTTVGSVTLSSSDAVELVNLLDTSLTLNLFKIRSLEDTVSAVTTVPTVDSPNSTVQAWQTIPYRFIRSRDSPYYRGEFSIIAGLIRPCSKANELIFICDQYFWNLYYARYLNLKIKGKDSLHLIIIVPPLSDLGNGTKGRIQHHLRREAFKALLNELDESQRKRIGLYTLWLGHSSHGIYCHAKSQAFDDALLVCGSANINRRSFTYDTELSCAVLGRDFVRGYYKRLWQYLFNDNLSIDFASSGWGKLFFEEFSSKLSTRFENGIEDPFEDPGFGNVIEDPWENDEVDFSDVLGYPHDGTRTNKLPNNFDEFPGLKPPAFGVFDPLSFKSKIENPIETGELPTLLDIVERIEFEDDNEFRIDKIHQRMI